MNELKKQTNAEKKKLYSLQDTKISDGLLTLF
jgi:hypothetical protein